MIDCLYFYILGNFLLHFGSFQLLTKIRKQQSAYGISLDSQLCLLVATIARAIWMRDNKSLNAFWLAHIEVVVAILMHALLVFQCWAYTDVLQQKIPVCLRWYTIVSFSLVLCCIAPGLNHENPIRHMLPALTYYIEALSLISQIYHMHISKQVDGLNRNYLMSLGVARLSRGIFWISNYWWWVILKDIWFYLAADALSFVMAIGCSLSYIRISKATANTSLLPSFSFET